MSRYAMVAAAVASLGGLLFGYDTGVISGAGLLLTRSFQVTSFTEELTVTVWIAAGFGVITLCFETKEKTLEEIDGYGSNGSQWEQHRHASVLPHVREKRVHEQGWQQ